MGINTKMGVNTWRFPHFRTPPIWVSSMFRPADVGTLCWLIFFQSQFAAEALYEGIDCKALHLQHGMGNFLEAWETSLTAIGDFIRRYTLW